MAGATEIYDADVIRFDAFYRTSSFIEKYDYGDYFKRNQLITQPEIFKQTFYYIGDTLYQQNLFLWGKIIRKKLFVDLIDNLTDFYKRQHWTLYEDNALLGANGDGAFGLNGGNTYTAGLSASWFITPKWT